MGDYNNLMEYLGYVYNLRGYGQYGLAFQYKDMKHHPGRFINIYSNAQIIQVYEQNNPKYPSSEVCTATFNNEYDLYKIIKKLR